MKACGARVSFEGKQIHIHPGTYTLDAFEVESDWSAASYWFQIAALLPGSEIRLPSLSRHSLQGDSVLIRIFAYLGVQSTFRGEELHLSSCLMDLPEHFAYDFKDCPDLVQTCAVTLCALGIPFRFTGTKTLRIKETDRIAALGAELKKLGYLLQDDPSGEWLSWDGSRCEPQNKPLIATYHDHRMAMAFAPMALTHGQLSIEDPGVVSKSYPFYWKDLEKAGFEIGS
jgi:3-phosphoshikimate 1-carboxyvinyltransferase